MKLEITKEELATISGSLVLLIQNLDLEKKEHKELYNIIEKLTFKIRDLSEKEGIIWKYI